MASTSSSFLSESLIRCAHTFDYLRHVTTSFPNSNSEVDRCITLIKEGVLNSQCIPLHTIDLGRLPSLTPECKRALRDSLITEISIGNAKITPFACFNALSKIKGTWAITLIGITGSAQPLTHSYWQILSAEMELKSHISDTVLEGFSSTTKPWTNLDSVICIQLGLNEDARKACEDEIKEILLNLMEFSGMSRRQLNHHIQGPTRIEGTGTFFTIRNEVRSFDLMLCFEKTPPKLFTKTDILVPVPHKIINKFDTSSIENWPDIQPIFIGVAPETLLIHRSLNIVCLNSLNEGSFNGNLGIIKKLIIEMSKGSLGIQKGTLKLALNIYLKKRQESYEIVTDAHRSFQEHLPKTPGALLSFFLHWVQTLNGQKTHQDFFVRQFNFKLIDSSQSPTHLLKTFTFIQQFPDSISVIFSLIKCIALFSFLKEPENYTSRGLFEGVLTLRFLLEKDSSAFFQFRLTRSSIFTQTLEILRDPNIQENAIDLFKEYLSYYDLNDSFPFHSASIHLLRDFKFPLEIINEIRQELALPEILQLKHEQAACSTEEMLPSELEEEIEAASSTEEVSPKRAPPLETLIASKNWKLVTKRLLAASQKPNPRENPHFGSYVWQLFAYWTRSLGKSSLNFSKQPEQMQILITAFHKVLKETWNASQNNTLYNLLNLTSFEPHIIAILSNLKSMQEEANDPTFSFLSENQIHDLLRKKLSNIYNIHTLYNLYFLAPSLVISYLNSQFNAKPLPDLYHLEILIEFCRKINFQDLDALSLNLTRSLLLERRYNDLKALFPSIDYDAICKPLFSLLLQKDTLLQALELLRGWEILRAAPLQEEHLNLLEAQIKAKQIDTKTVRSVISIWAEHRELQDTLAEQSLKLCHSVAVSPINNPNIGALWFVLQEGNNLGKISSLAQWSTLLSNLYNHRNFVEAWEALRIAVPIAIKKKNQKSSIDKVFMGLLRLGLSPKTDTRVLDARNIHLLPVINTLCQLFDQPAYKDRLDLRFKITRNLIAVSVHHPDPNEREKHFNLGCQLVNRVRDQEQLFYALCNPEHPQSNEFRLAYSELNQVRKALGFPTLPPLPKTTRKSTVRITPAAVSRAAPRPIAATSTVHSRVGTYALLLFGSLFSYCILKLLIAMMESSGLLEKSYLNLGEHAKATAAAQKLVSIPKIDTDGKIKVVVDSGIFWCPPEALKEAALTFGEKLAKLCLADPSNGNFNAC